MTSTVPPPPFHVQSTVDNPKTFAHHLSVSQLWNTRWRPSCAAGIYPFEEGSVVDFDPIFKSLIEASGDDVSVLYDPEAYARPFVSVERQLVKRADEALAAGHKHEAIGLYHRASAICRIARFPIVRSELGKQVWKEGKVAYEKAGRLMDPPLQPLTLPFTKVDFLAGDLNDSIPVYLTLPKTPKPATGYPVLLLICGLDAYRTDQASRLQKHLSQGLAVLQLEIPGTGDSPCAPRDPTSPDRFFDSVLDWISGEGNSRYGLDASNVVARGISTGGYYAFRIAHTHAARLRAAISHGGACHWMFCEPWVRAQNYMEYPFALADAVAYKFGYASVDDFLAAKPIEKYSLEATGILQRPSCRLLFVNGTEDSVFPIEDGLLVAARGRTKDVRLIQGCGHMGRPYGEDVVYGWIDDLMILPGSV